MPSHPRTSPCGGVTVARRCVPLLALMPFFTSLILETFLTPSVRAQAADGYIGARVLARTSETKLKVGSKVSATLTAGSVFRVEQVNGKWLWVDSGNIQGWVKQAHLVPFDQ